MSGHRQDLFLDLLPSAARIVTRRVNDVLRPFRITSAQYSIVRLLIQAGPMTPKEISTRLVTDISTIVGIITRLERDQFVVRKPSPKDGRSTVLEASDCGRAVYRDAQPEVERLISDLVHSMSDEEQSVLHRVLSTSLQVEGWSSSGQS